VLLQVGGARGGRRIEDLPCGHLQEHQAEREQIRARIQRLEEERFG
jgi:hypothetical protein